METKDVAISVIVPAYNAERTIRRALVSILNQSAIGYIKEVIVINDGSIDDTERIINTIIDTHPNGRLINYVAIVNGGVSNARNVGIEKASGNWIAFLDSDDAWKNKKIELQVDAILNYNEIRFIGTNSQMGVISYGKRLSKDLRKISYIQYMLKSSPSTCSILFEKKLVDEVGLFDVNQSHAEDSNLFMRMIYRSGGYYLRDQLLILDEKPTFGSTGLSANLKEMHLGCLKNITDARSLGYISYLGGTLLAVWENLKYSRRIALTKYRIRRRTSE